MAVDLLSANGSTLNVDTHWWSIYFHFAGEKPRTGRTGREQRAKGEEMKLYACNLLFLFLLAHWH
jgi:hypothetical protein